MGLHSQIKHLKMNDYFNNLQYIETHFPSFGVTECTCMQDSPHWKTHWDERNSVVTRIHNQVLNKRNCKSNLTVG